ncbi:differentially expressed in FDCP 6 homolog [Mizuhopecten yessoensis]|uniref:differentially expressed in FDCP 6 homolog n=1 Tax=Mizuhopecten yessoensis TaxID=6573 RepID=UPI000B45E53C|nr:differentially expressed in FDCP 6 homolog [Mizuhopecten yessoensis]
MSSKEQNKVNITESTMKRNWTTLLKIDINDILGKMIEQDLISIEKSRELREIGTKTRQTEALLYQVIEKPQPYLDAFIKILDVKGYDFIAQKLRKDAVKEASEVTYRDHSDTLQQEKETFSESAMQQSEMEEKLVQRAMKRIEKNQSQFTEEQMQTLMMQMEKHQLKMAEEQEQVLKEQLEKQTLEMTKHYTQISKKQEDMKKQISKIKQKDDNHKECETKIKQLESKIRTLENTLQQERAKVNDDVTNAWEKIDLLEEERDKLQDDLAQARKDYVAMFNEMKKDILPLKTSNNRVEKCDNFRRNLNQEHSDRCQADRRAKKGEGVSKKKN